MSKQNEEKKRNFLQNSIKIRVINISEYNMKK